MPQIFNLMRTLLIENQPIADIINKTCSTNIDIYDVGQAQSVEALADDIKNHYSSSVDLFIIDVHLTIGNSLLSDNLGIKLLKLLRLHDINNHVVLFSWLSREMLMTDINNVIIFSKGISFYRLPDFFHVVSNINQERLQEKANPQELLQLFRAEYDPDNRHFDANIFGIWQLLKSQEAYERLCDIVPPQDCELENVAQFMNTYHSLLARFVNHTEAEILDHHYIDALLLRNEKVAVILERTIPKKIENRRGDIQNLNRAISDLNESKDPKEDVFERRQKLIYRKEQYEKEIQILQQYLDYCQSKEYLHNNVMLSMEPDSKDCFDVRKQLRDMEPNIVFVDDLADQGWSDILQRMIYGKKSSRFRTIIPQVGESPEEIANRVWLASKPSEYYPGSDLIILDIRLKNEHGYIQSSHLSGLEVLRLLNLKTKCPILMFSASNKIWSFKKAIKGNALSYWMKGRVENKDIDIVDDYLDLVDLIYSLVSIKWVFEIIADIKNMASIIKKSYDPYWWETYHVSFCLEAKDDMRKEPKANQGKCYERKLTSKKVIVDLLNNAAAITMNSMRSLFTRGLGLDVDSVCCVMILQLSFVLDEIHRSEGFGPGSIEPASLQYRMAMHFYDKPKQQKMVNILGSLRNIAVHRGGDSCFEKYQVQEFMRILTHYLTQDMTSDGLLAEADGCTPMDERQQALDNGQSIKVTIVQKQRVKNGSFLHFKTDPSQEDVTPFVFVHKKISECFQQGGTMVVKTNDNNAIGTHRYLIVPQITPIEERMARLERGEVIFVKVERMAETKEVQKYGFKIDDDNYYYATISKAEKSKIVHFSIVSMGDVLSVKKDGKYCRPFGLYRP